MRSRTSAMVVCLLLAASSLAAQPRATGIWEGQIEIPGAPLRIAVTLVQNREGRWTGRIDIPAQNAMGLPLRNVAAEGEISFEIGDLPGSPRFSGTLDVEGTTLRGTFTQSGNRFPFALTRTADGPRRPPRPQEPTKPYPYSDIEVRFPGGSPDVMLGGTLTVPPTEGPHPAVVLVTGSGAQDRDETVADHKPFLVLADHLTRAGYAVLRTDDRGIGASTGTIAEATSEDFALDALAGVAYLGSRPEIDTERIGLVGHSEGANVAAIAAARAPQLAFIVMMAGAGMSGENIVYLQSRMIMRASGAPEAQITAQIARMERMYRVVREETDLEVMRSRIRAIGGDGSARSLTSPWFRFFLKFDPRTALEKVQCPVLVLNGERDLQVPFKENLDGIEAALRKSGNTRFTIHSLPELNHLFQRARTGLPAEYPTLTETMSTNVLEMIADWLRTAVPR